MTLPRRSSTDEINALAGLPNDNVWTRLELGWALLAGLSVAAVGGFGLLIGRSLAARQLARPR